MLDTIRTVALAILLCAIAGSDCAAQDVPLSADKLLLRRSADGREKLIFRAKDAGVEMLFADDPALAGLSIDLIASNGAEIATLTIPPDNGEGRWKITGDATTPPTFRYKNPDAPLGHSPVRSFLMHYRQRSLKIVADATGLGLTGPSGPVGVRIRFYSVRGCTHFGATTIRKDQARLFSAVHASATALQDCYDNSVAGVPPLCGDHLSSANEQCDGTCSSPPFGTFGCVIPGAPNECTCCSNGFPSSLPCCQPSKVWYNAPNSKYCYPNSCAAPFECLAGDVCQPDETCCHGLGTMCAVLSLGNLLECCAGTCGRPYSGGGSALECCVASGDACTDSAHCCTSDCKPDGTCATCAPAGAPCYVGTPCCSGTCSSGTCE